MQWNPLTFDCICSTRQTSVVLLTGTDSYVKLILLSRAVYRQQTYVRPLGAAIVLTVGMKTWLANPQKVLQRQFSITKSHFSPVLPLEKHVAKRWRKRQVRLECENLRNARSPRGGDPKPLLLQDKLTFTLTFTRYVQTTPYLITLICILSRGVPSNVNLIPLHCAGTTYLWG